MGHGSHHEDCSHRAKWRGQSTLISIFGFVEHNLVLPLKLEKRVILRAGRATGVNTRNLSIVESETGLLLQP